MDLGKVYDWVNLGFLFEILESRGFGLVWFKWIRKRVVGGSLEIDIN